MYIIFNLDPDGDSYSLHGRIEDARYVFDKKVKRWSEAVNNREEVGWDDYIGVKPLTTERKLVGMITKLYYVKSPTSAISASVPMVMSMV